MSTPMHSRGFSAFLFDMDGTLVDSHPVVLRVWSGWLRKHGLDVDAILPTVHGVRIADTVRRLAVPGLDPDEEAAKLTAAETADVEGIVPIQGAREFFHAIPPRRRAIVTSATLEMARGRLKAAGIDVPDVLITGQDVQKGKPAPDCFLMAAARLGVGIADCLIFEDAVAGIRAAEASGASVAIVTSSHEETMQTDHPTTRDYRALGVRVDDGNLFLVAA